MRMAAYAAHRKQEAKEARPHMPSDKYPESGFDLSSRVQPRTTSDKYLTEKKSVETGHEGELREAPGGSERHRTAPRGSEKLRNRCLGIHGSGSGKTQLIMNLTNHIR